MSNACNPSHPGHRALRKGRASSPRNVYHVTATTWARAPLFAEYRMALAACRCFENPVLLHDARMLAWVLMPDHAHWLIELGDAWPLHKLVHALKAFSAINANREAARDGRVWARAYHDHAVREEEDIVDVARYIIANPLRAGLVTRIGNYPYWNAVWL